MVSSVSYIVVGGEQVVCNPTTTGKSVTLPTVTVKSAEMIVRSFLGYDPVDAQYKVLCLTNIKEVCQHQVLTLGSAQWRMIHFCSTPHYALGTNYVCVGGVLYYTASTSYDMKEPLLVGFDLRSETLEIASTFPEGYRYGKFRDANLINHHGKSGSCPSMCGSNRSFQYVGFRGCRETRVVGKTPVAIWKWRGLLVWGSWSFSVHPSNLESRFVSTFGIT
ncbi:unnamed protein product [Microthlaspi erraticum]|uniref:F-box associated beta-propeller type 3 domain-containing protein n=1 Tax=Microthlaspi erraticum TaxID=1685480 RepID=A0A6D2IAU4_9BRAS|nr:unnamed protein product [Microthlaspi erraticum]